MPVVINEFEVVPQTQGSGQGGETQSPHPAAPAPQLSPQDLDRIEERLKERMLRVWAH
jgi:hypothetical protein